MSWSEKDDIKVILKRYFSFDCKWSNTRRKVIEYIGWDENQAVELLKPEDLINMWNKFAREA